MYNGGNVSNKLIYRDNGGLWMVWN